MAINNLAQFLNGIEKRCGEKILSREEEFALGEIIQRKDIPEIDRKDAIDKLVIHNIFLVVKLSHKYKRNEFDFEDIVGYGIVGLFTAAKKFDPSQNIRFASYARHWIKESIMKAIREYSGAPKIPVYLVKNLWAVTRLLAKEDYSDAEIAALVDIPESSAAHLRSLIFKVVQMDSAPVALSDSTPEEDYTEQETSGILFKEMKRVLTPDQFTVIAHLMAFDGYEKMTLTEIENNLNIKHARKLRAAAFCKLKNCSVLQTLYEEMIDE